MHHSTTAMQSCPQCHVEAKPFVFRSCLLSRCTSTAGAQSWPRRRTLTLAVALAGVGLAGLEEAAWAAVAACSRHSTGDSACRSTAVGWSPKTVLMLGNSSATAVYRYHAACTEDVSSFGVFWVLLTWVAVVGAAAEEACT